MVGRLPKLAEATAERRTVDQVIEEMGFGWSQLRDNVLVNGSWLADGSEALMISALTVTLAAEWSLSPAMQGALSSVVYAGTLVGSVLSGLAGDACGRRAAILLSFPVILAFSLLSSGASRVGQLLLLRCMVGVGFGVGQPNAVAMLVEVTPVRWRVLNQGLAQVAFALGELFCCLCLWLDDPSLERLSWRRQLAAAALPAGLFWVAAGLFLRESPAFLALRDPGAAREVLGAMRRANGAEHVSLEFTPPAAAGRAAAAREGSAAAAAAAQLRALVGPQLRWTTAALCFICLAYNLTIYGAFFALPQLLPGLHVGVSAAAALAIGALVEIPFDFIGVAVGMAVSRKRALSSSLFGVAVSLLLFAGGGDGLAFRLGYVGLKGLPQVSSLVLYVFAAESYPVAVRATGTALVMGFGRLGAILSPLVYEWMARDGGGHSSFFILAACLTLASVAALAPLSETLTRAEGQDATGKAEEEGEEGEKMALLWRSR